MIENWQLPPELERLQQDLAARPRPQPSAELKRRVMRSLGAELQRPQTGSRWAFAAAVAAAAMVWLNLSLSATRATDFHLELDGRYQPIEMVAAEIQRLLPEIPAREAMRQAILLRASSGLVPYPNLPAGSVPRGPIGDWGKFLTEERTLK